MEKLGLTTSTDLLKTKGCDIACMTVVAHDSLAICSSNLIKFNMWVASSSNKAFVGTDFKSIYLLILY